MVEVVTFGETMVLMDPRDPGPLRHASEFRRRQAGAESNVAIGLARLGREASWFGRLGADPFGRYVECTIRGEGVDTSAATRDDAGPTGLMIKERRSAGDERVYYYRDGSAASHFSSADLPETHIAEASYIHLTGITPALSATCREAVFDAVAVAREHDVRVSFDPNLRRKLWDDRDEMVETVMALVAAADVVFPGVGEVETLLGTGDPAEAADELLAAGPSVAVVKAGADGAYVAGSGTREHVPAFDVDPVDEIGAGDGFVAGFLAARLVGADPVEATRQGNAVGALATTVPGDVEGLPTREELETFRGERETIVR